MTQEQVPAARKVPWTLVLRYVLLLAVIAYAIYFLSTQWSGIRATLTTIAPLSLVLSTLSVALGLACGTMSWVAVLNGLGDDRVPAARGAQIMLVGSLGKYVPGSLWAYLMQMELGRQYGVQRARVLLSSLYSAGIGVVASLILGSLALPTVFQGQRELLWLFLLLPVGLVCLHPRVMTFLAGLVFKVARRTPLTHRVSGMAVLKALGWVLVSYLFYGLHLWLLANSLVDPSLYLFVLLTGAISLGFTIGLFAFVLPSGVGAREAVLIGALSIVLTQAQGAGISLVSRATFTLVDLVGAGVAALAAVALRKRLAASATAETPVEPEPTSAT